MDFELLLQQITPEVYENLKRAVEIGKWPDGRLVTDEQRELCMQAVLAYDLKYLPEEERVGFIDRGSKEDGEVCSDSNDVQSIEIKQPK